MGPTPSEPPVQPIGIGITQALVRVILLAGFINVGIATVILDRNRPFHTVNIQAVRPVAVYLLINCAGKTGVSPRNLSAPAREMTYAVALKCM